jgi:hypothetical protein
LAGAAAVAVIGGGVALGLVRGWQDGRLSPPGRVAMSAVARAMLEGSLPADADEAQAAIDAQLVRLEALIAGMPVATQREVGDLLTILTTPPGRRVLAGLSPSWHEASIAQLQAVLQAMRQSRWLLRRQAYHALRELTLGAYFADAAAWPLLRYPGPRAID